MKRKNIIILGAASSIAEHVARLYAVEGANILIAGRRSERLDAIACDLRARGAGRVEAETVDFVEDDASVLLPRMVGKMKDVDHVWLTWGFMAPQEQVERDLRLAEQTINVNFRSTACWALAAATILEQRGAGTLVAFGSPAGDRGRRSNFVYGASKAGVATLMEGISHRFAASSPRLRAVLIKPGPTETPMTATHEKGGPLWSTPERIAPLIARAINKGSPVAYVPARWRFIMLIVRALPRFIFNRLNF